MLTRNEAIDHLSEVFVVLATTNIRGLPTEVELGPADGMPRGCVLNADHVASLPKGYLGELITTLSAERLTEVSVSLWITPPAADDQQGGLGPQCVPQNRNRPYRCAIPGQAGPRNCLHLRTFP